MQYLVAGASSLSARYLISQAASLSSPVAKVYNALDMVIGLVVFKIMENMGKGDSGVLASRIIGCMTAAILTGYLAGPIGLIEAIALSTIAPTIGVVLTLLTTRDFAVI